MVNSPSPSWCNCHLDTQPRHCRVCAPERKPTRKQKTQSGNKPGKEEK